MKFQKIMLGLALFMTTGSFLIASQATEQPKLRLPAANNPKRTSANYTEALAWINRKMLYTKKQSRSPLKSGVSATAPVAPKGSSAQVLSAARQEALLKSPRAIALKYHNDRLAAAANPTPATREEALESLRKSKIFHHKPSNFNFVIHKPLADTEAQLKAANATNASAAGQSNGAATATAAAANSTVAQPNKPLRRPVMKRSRLQINRAPLTPAAKPAPTDA